MYAGKVIERAPVLELFERPRHPYTQGLLRAIPRLDHPHKIEAGDDRGHGARDRQPAAGVPLPEPLPYRVDRCAEAHPPLEAVSCRITRSPATAGGRSRRREPGRHPSIARGRAPPHLLSGARGRLPHRAGDLQSGRRRVVHDRVRRDAGAGGRVRLRQVDAGEDGGAPAQASGRRRSLRRDGPGAALAPRAQAVPPQHPDDLPGPGRLAQLEAERGQAAGGAVRHPRPGQRRRAARVGGAAARDGGAAGARGRSLPVRVLGRAAPAHRHRARDRAAPEAGAVRRAGVGARRLDPEPDPQPAARSAARAGIVVSVRVARSGGGQARLGSHRRHVPRPHRRDRTTRSRCTLRPKHPYTRVLLAAVPVPDPRKRRRLEVVEGDVPTPINPPSGCHFHPRCPHAEERCRVEDPALREVGEAGGPSQRVACHFDL